MAASTTGPGFTRAWRLPANLLVLASMAWAVVTFNLPWVRLEMRRATYTQATYGRGTAKASADENSSAISRAIGKATAGFRKGAKQAGQQMNLQVPTRITGAQVPYFANHEGTKTVMQLVERFAKKSEHLGLKSYAVYALPGLVLLLGVTLLCWGRLLAVSAVVSFVGLAVPAVGAWQLLTLKISTPMMKVHLQPGLWLALTPYLGLLAAAVGRILRRPVAKLPAPAPSAETAV